MNAAADGPSADEIIRLLELRPHPEGGHYRETFRDPEGAASRRAASTAIYFLLQAGEVSRWHRVDAAEVWHATPRSCQSDGRNGSSGHGGDLAEMGQVPL
jgi:predicted cupin superfamily sugar epimerase